MECGGVLEVSHVQERLKRFHEIKRHDALKWMALCAEQSKLGAGCQGQSAQAAAQPQASQPEVQPQSQTAGAAQAQPQSGTQSLWAKRAREVLGPPPVHDRKLDRPPRISYACAVCAREEMSNAEFEEELQTPQWQDLLRRHRSVRPCSRSFDRWMETGRVDSNTDLESSPEWTPPESPRSRS